MYVPVRVVGNVLYPAVVIRNPFVAPAVHDFLIQPRIGILQAIDEILNILLNVDEVKEQLLNLFLFCLLLSNFNEVILAEMFFNSRLNVAEREVLHEFVLKTSQAINKLLIFGFSLRHG